MPPELDDDALEARLFPPQDELPTERVTPDWNDIHQQLRLPGVTLQLLWEEYKARHAERESQRMARRLANAKWRQQAYLEDLDFRAPRGLDRTLLARLSEGTWLREGHHILITGPTGIGKTYLACALAQKACRDGTAAYYVRMPRLVSDLAAARAEGRHRRLLETLVRKPLLVLDDWGLNGFSDELRRDLLELVEERHDRRSIVITSQFPIDQWHDLIGDPTLADAILDRLVHKAHKIALKGASMRKTRMSPPDGDAQDA